MATGPGRYDHLATYCREKAEAEAVIVIIIGGNLGSGFSVQTDATGVALPRLLRNVADEIERDLGGKGG